VDGVPQAESISFDGQARVSVLRLPAQAEDVETLPAWMAELLAGELGAIETISVDEQDALAFTITRTDFDGQTNSGIARGYVVYQPEREQAVIVYGEAANTLDAIDQLWEFVRSAVDFEEPTAQTSLTFPEVRG
ncbi:MAG: hypothetical protein K8I30_20605, partial [Anaerolineae bacterium]|nr:hypothetical protein [Anaerolineae bacterium]